MLGILFNTDCCCCCCCCFFFGRNNSHDFFFSSSFFSFSFQKYFWNLTTCVQLALEERNACAEAVARLRETFGESDHQDATRSRASSFVPTKSACDLVRSTPLERSDIESLLGDLMFAESDDSSSSSSSSGGGSSSRSGSGSGARKESDSAVSRIELNAHEFSKCIGRLLGNLGRTDQRVQIWQSLAFSIFATVRDEQQNPISVNLQRFACVLSLFHRGTDVEERLRLCFSCFDVAQTGSISVVDLKRVFEAAYAFFCPGISNDDIVSLAGKVVRKLGLGRKKKIDFSSFSNFLLSVSVLSDLVRDVDGSQYDQPYAV